MHRKHLFVLLLAMQLSSVVPRPSLEPSCSPGTRTQDPQSCRRYFVCNSRGALVPMACPVHLTFDPEELACRPGHCTGSEKEAKSKETQNNSKSGTTVGENNVNSTVHVTFSTTRHVSEILNVVHKKSNASNNQNVTRTSIKISEPIITEQTNSNRETFNKSILKNDLIVESRAACEPGVAVRNPNSCVSYFLCNGTGVFEIKRCPSKTNFDAAKNKCTSDVQCSHRSRPHVSAAYAKVTRNFELLNSHELGLGNINEKKENVSCSLDVHLPLEGDCTKYQFCNEDGTLEIHSCPRGFYFDPLLSNCRFSNGSSCADLPPKPCTGPQCSRGNRTGMVAKPRQLDTPLLKGCEPGSRDLSPSRCDWFRECDSSGEYTISTCPMLELYDSRTQSCVRDTDCGERHNPYDPSRTPLTTPTSCPGGDCTAANPCSPGERVTHPLCHNYLECEPPGVWGGRQCPGSQLFDAVSLRCTATVQCGDRVNPYDTVSTEARCELGSLTSDREDCSVYFQCGPQGRLQLRQCPSGLWFDQKAEKCVAGNCGQANNTP